MIIDSHVHLFPPAVTRDRETYLGRDLTFRALYADARAKMCDADKLVQTMDVEGIDIAVVVNIGWKDPDAARETNDYLLESAQRYAGRLIPFCALNPLDGDRAVREIERCVALGARGIGELHPDTQGFDLGDRAVMAPVMAAAAFHGLPVLAHASEPVGHRYPGKGLVTPDVLCRFVGNFPESRVILAHWGGGLPFYALMPEVRQMLVNVSFDSAASPFLYDPHVFDVVASLVGVDRVLFGTDFPLIGHRRLLRQVEESALDSAAKDRVLGANASSLLGINQ